MRFILASSSPRRQELLCQLGLRFEIIKPEIDETQRAGEDPLAYVERLSQQKAAAVAHKLGASSAAPALIIAADTIVLAAGALLGKPVAADDARQMLRSLRGRPHEVITAFTLYQQAAPPRRITRHARTIVHMREYSDAEIEAYIATGDPFDKAGGYAIQNEAFHPVAHIEGSYSNVVGLPLAALQAALHEIS